MNPGSKYFPWASISIPPFSRIGLLSFISNPGYPTFIIFLIIFFSITTSTGPVGGAPFPFINVAPLMISWLYGPLLYIFQVLYLFVRKYYCL